MKAKAVNLIAAVRTLLRSKYSSGCVLCIHQPGSNVLIEDDRSGCRREQDREEEVLTDTVPLIVVNIAL